MFSKLIKENNWIFFIVLVPTIAVGIFLLIKAHYFLPDTPSINKTLTYVGGLITIFFPTFIVGVILWFFKKSEEHDKWLIENGIKAKAKLLNYEETGCMINNRPKIAMKLEISTSYHGTYQLIHKECVSLLNLHLLTIGKVFPVYVHPQNSKNILINWNEIKNMEG